MTGIAYEQAPAWVASQWLNTQQDISLDSLRGSVVVLHAFQMLCPGCVSHGIPQAKAIHAAFPPDKVRSEEHTSELQSLMRTSYAVFCLKKKNKPTIRKRYT